MSFLNLFIAEPRRKITIEAITQAFLKRSFQKHLVKPGKLNVECLVDLELLKYYKYTIELVPVMETGIEARTLPFERKIQFLDKVYCNMTRGNGRDRFTACHEAYHVIDHSYQILKIGLENILESISLNRINSPVYCDPEWQAHHGAGALLMPKTTLIPFVEALYNKGTTKENIIYEIREKYGVSYSAAETRFHKIKALESLTFKGFPRPNTLDP